ncbi:MAG: hypothetical protein AAGG01_04440 [Planctomycetota bacterium]
MSQEDPEVSTFEWTPPGVLSPDPNASAPEPLVPGDLADDLLPTVENRGLTGAEIVQKVAREAAAWLRDERCRDAGVAGALLDLELAAVREAHAWRAPVARFFASLARVATRTPVDGGPALREALGDECAAWSEAPSDRLPDRSRCAASLLDADPLQPATGLESGEMILIHGWSETVARAVELACARGIKPHLIVSEGGPDLGGRRLARRLVASGLSVDFIYDAALVDACRRVDRIWLGTEAIGVDGLVARVGTHGLLSHARELGVPAVVIATGDKLLEDGVATELPTWAAEEPWHLWEGAPEGVRVDSQSFERVPLELPSLFALEGELIGSTDMLRRVGGARGRRPLEVTSPGLSIQPS